MIMNLSDRFEDWLKNVKGLAPGTAQDYASHIRRISEAYLGVDDRPIPRRWMKALRYYIEFLNQL